MRCLTLADALKTRGAKCEFIMRGHVGNLCDFVEGRGYSVRRLPQRATPLADDGITHAKWLGTSWQDDSRETAAAMSASDSLADWLIVDHYAIDERWENALRSSATRIMVIDDLADRRHDCDVILDQNLIAGNPVRYAALVPPSARVLSGPRFALLQLVYAQLHDRIPPRTGAIRRMNIFFGGADVDDLTGNALSAVLAVAGDALEIDVVLARGSLHPDTVYALASEYSNVHVHTALHSLAPLLARADFGIGGAGTTSWERLCVGLPTLLITVAENQKPIAEELDRLRLAEWFGHGPGTDWDALRRRLEDILRAESDTERSARCRAAVDGKGCERVIAAMASISGNSAMSVRKVRASDGDALRIGVELEGRNAETAARLGAGFSTWFDSILRDVSNAELYVILEGGEVVGDVLFRHRGDRWSVDSFVPDGISHYRRAALLKSIEAFRADRPAALYFTPSEQSTGFRQALGSGARVPPAISVCSDERSWLNKYIPNLVINWLERGHDVTWSHHANELGSGDLCFYLGYGKVVAPEILARHARNLVVHESALPKGRGWSPMTWEVLQGADHLTVSLIEAADSVDAGDIYIQEQIRLQGDELVDELRELQAGSTIRLCEEFVARYPQILADARPQVGEPTFYPRRRAVDGKLDVSAPLSSQFNLLRISDNDRYPAWFELQGKRYSLAIRKLPDTLPEVTGADAKRAR
jgi:UDP-2,4-diacetamido-2,4,6-trideoxy-beta-L-altropyranose hydrolase